jgi:hypothetical protein
MISATRAAGRFLTPPNGGDIAFNGTSIVGRTAYDICRLGNREDLPITK